MSKQELVEQLLKAIANKAEAEAQLDEAKKALFKNLSDGAYQVGNILIEIKSTGNKQNHHRQFYLTEITEQLG